MCALGSGWALEPAADDAGHAAVRRAKQRTGQVDTGQRDRRARQRRAGAACAAGTAAGISRVRRRTRFLRIGARCNPGAVCAVMRVAGVDEPTRRGILRPAVRVRSRLAMNGGRRRRRVVAGRAQQANGRCHALHRQHHRHDPDQQGSPELAHAGTVSQRGHPRRRASMTTPPPDPMPWPHEGHAVSPSREMAAMVCNARTSP